MLRNENVKAASSREAKKLAQAASQSGSKAFREPPHGQGQLPHWHPDPKPGPRGFHVFYSIGAGLPFPRDPKCPKGECLEEDPKAVSCCLAVHMIADLKEGSLFPTAPNMQSCE